MILGWEPAARLRYARWSPLRRPPGDPEHRSVLTLCVSAQGQGSRVAITHDSPWALALVEHAAFRWRGAPFQLRRLVEDGPPPG